MHQHVLEGLTLILVAGILAQWIAWRTHLPSILLLLAVGLMAGPALKLIQPDELFGTLLFPIVSLSVAIILFEGGLSLRYRDFKESGWTVSRLVLGGGLTTAVLSAFAARYVLHLSWELSALLGSVLVVTGPTVIIPLLHHIRPAGRIGTIARWEGIMNDPIGAILAVLVFEFLLAAHPGTSNWFMLKSFFLAIGVGVLLGLAGGLVLYLLLRRYWLPDWLHSPMTLMLVLVVFALSNRLQPESGLLSTTLMGMVLANQRRVSIKTIIQFKENLQVLLISFLFVVLAARLQPHQLNLLSFSSLAFLGLLIFLIRPLAVWLSTIGSELNRAERLFLCFLAPRGIVAAAVISVFSLELTRRGLADAERLVPLVFLVILGTVAFYGLSAAPIAYRLGLAQPSPQGVLFAGADPWVRQLALTLQTHGFRTVLVDSNLNHVFQARLQGLETHHENILSEFIFDEINLGGIGRLLAVTPNDEVNALACLHFQDFFGRQEVYQLPPEPDPTLSEDEVPIDLRGRVLFGKDATWNRLNLLFSRGAEIKATPLTETYTFQTYQTAHAGHFLLLFIVTGEGKLLVQAEDMSIEPGPGDTLIALVWEEDQKATRETAHKNHSKT